MSQANLGGVYNPGQQVEVDVNGEWIPAQIQNVENFTVRNSITRRETNKPPNQVFAIGGLPNSTGANTHYMPGSPILFQGPHRWIKLLGTLISKNYVVQIDGRTETVPHTRIRRVTAQSRAAQSRAAQAQTAQAQTAQPQAPVMPRTMTDDEFWRQIREIQQEVTNQNGNRDDEEDHWGDSDDEDYDEDGEVGNTAAALPAGVAFEVHTEFQQFKATKWDKFMEIINRTTGTNTEFRNSEEPLQPLIDYVNTSKSYNPVFNLEDKSLTSEEKDKMMEMKDEMEKRKVKTIKQIGILFTEIQKYRKYEENIDNITNCIQYVLMQPPEFVDAYINTFIVDYCQAYERGRKESCVKGVYERVYLSFRDTVKTLCLDQIQGIGPAPLCKPEYIEIFDCFYENIPQSDLNDYLKDWYDEINYDEFVKLTPEDRLDHFVGFVKKGMNDENRFNKNEASIRRYYINQKIDDDFIVDENVGKGERNRRTSKRRLNSKKQRTIKKRSDNKRLKSKKRGDVKHLKSKYSRKRRRK